MCGIFGYVGKKTNAPKLVLQGLKLLEYRGYDSWGIGAKPISKLEIRNSKFIIEKHVGKIGDVTLNSQLSTLSSELSIGHTRWATHGGVTDINAHPHLDCTKSIAVVHNGIVENFQELKDDLIKKGHRFVSDTDTEVIPHLIEEFLKRRGFASSVRDAFNKLKGLNAIVVANAKSSEIIAAKNGSPLVIGVSKDGLYVSSDATGIVKHTRKVIFLEDNQMAILGQKIKLIILPNGSEIRPKVSNLTWKFEDAEKGKFKHFFLKEIYEQPKVLEGIATNSSQIKKISDLVRNAFGTFFIACGSASYSALAGTYLFSKIAKKHVNFAIGSEFNYLEDYIEKGTLVIPISQSGESVDVIEPVTRAKKKGAKIIGIVNVLGSTLYRISDYKILLNAGPEKAVVATKSLTAMIATMMLIAYSLVNKLREGRTLILKSSRNVGEILKDEYVGKIKKIARKLKDHEHIYVIGRGLSYATALEATLKIKEATYIHAEGFAAGELKHGVIALIDKKTPCMVFAPNDETYDEIISNAQEVKARGGYIIGIGPRNNEVFEEFLSTGDLGEATMISQIVVAQLLAYFLALERGVEDPDKPRNLAKSVTVK
ncbi:MAG: glutamine--fructose-6-phosphate aminotransferase [Candidatus Levybacteria bacterium RIFCSPHIGHO2_01_FULL_41_15]|nr:MAG: glutamine--fructose-6-phosphate aminotransferase [Candidatus Levybacteria bacterium RIFCSPHIGHO2_01_FULL_41_15]